MTHPRSHYVLLIALIAGVLLLDQVTKLVAVDRLQFSGRHSFVGDTLRLEYAENRGAFLSLGANLPAGVRTAIFSGVVSVGVLLLLIATFRAAERRSAFPLALISAGGVGNLIDRYYRDGAVIDFLNVGIGDVRTGIFNVADMAIMGGIIWLLLADFVLARRAKAEAQPTP